MIALVRSPRSPEPFLTSAGGLSKRLDGPRVETLVCPTCVNDEWGGYAFERVRRWALYEGALVRAMLLLKFENIEPQVNCSRDGSRK
jgi:hypothetical protein